MSSTSSGVPGSVPSQSPSSDETTEDMRPGTGYFLGFLAMFVILLFIFVGCGLASRARYNRRRATPLNDTWRVNVKAEPHQKEPVFWEQLLVKGGDMWDTMMPLSISILQPQRQNEDYTSNRIISEPTPHSLANFPLSTSWIPSARQTTSSSKISVNVTQKPSESSELQVALMIALPSPNKHPSDNLAKDRPIEYQIGVIHIPWERELAS